MPETVAVIVASYGDKQFWDSLGERALASVANQTRQPDDLLRIHGEDLHSCRNEGAERAKTDLLCFLDCDDELEPPYLEAMLHPATYPIEMRYPRVRYVTENLVDMKFIPEPIVLPRRALDRGNFMVIGTVVPRETFLEAGGFRELRAYEDWDCWIRLWMLGAEPRLVKDAIYRATKRRGSRNIIKDPQLVCDDIITYNKVWQAGMKREGRIR
jgi:glycosyltransferase involved in cell wall biosynthesis